MSETRTIKALVWDENPPHMDRSIYPEGINRLIADAISRFSDGKIEAHPVHLDEPEQGLPQELLQQADVLFWWGHARHTEVADELVERIRRRVHDHGMGFVAIHSTHYAKPFLSVLGCDGHLLGGWRVADPPEKEFVRVCAPWHPIARGIEDFTIDAEEMYGAPFDVPTPLEIIFQSHFPLDGTTFPSGLCWTVGKGKTKPFKSGPGRGIGQGHGVGRVFYFRPGHETFPTFHLEPVQRILANAAFWCAGHSRLSADDDSRKSVLESARL